jgi:hypothetical protein
LGNLPGELSLDGTGDLNRVRRLLRTVKRVNGESFVIAPAARLAGSAAHAVRDIFVDPRGRGRRALESAAASPWRLRAL